jgi:hypothetical protein
MCDWGSPDSCSWRCSIRSLSSLSVVQGMAALVSTETKLKQLPVQVVVKFETLTMTGNPIRGLSFVSFVSLVVVQRRYKQRKLL